MDMSKVFHGILWILALTSDSFVVSFAYGMEKIKLSFLMVVGMNLIMSCLLGMAVLTGNFLSCFLSKTITSLVCTGILAGMGFYRIFVCFFSKQEADGKEKKRHLTGIEAMLLAVVLSLDSLAVGLGTGLVQTGGMLLAAGSFAGGILMMEAGWKLGNAFCISVKKDLSWLSGACLVLLAAGLWFS